MTTRASTMTPRYDVIVIGGGNAALCAAIEARRGGRSVLILEAAPTMFRGGNSRHTRNVRYLHRGEDFHLVGDYLEDEFYQDLLDVTGGNTDERLARLTIRASEGVGHWMAGNGITWQGALRGTLQLSRTNAFFLGGGKALLNTYYETARKLGIEVQFDAEVCGLEVRPGDFHQITVGSEAAARLYEAKVVVAASGGFEANLDWLGEYWGEAAQNFLIRGTPYNKGGVLKLLLAAGAKAIGDPREYHAVACDARGPQFDGGIVTRLGGLGDRKPQGPGTGLHAIPDDPDRTECRKLPSREREIGPSSSVRRLRQTRIPKQEAPVRCAQRIERRSTLTIGEGARHGRRQIELCAFAGALTHVRADQRSRVGQRPVEGHTHRAYDHEVIEQHGKQQQAAERHQKQRQ